MNPPLYSTGRLLTVMYEAAHVNLNDPSRAIHELERAIESGERERIARAALDNVWPLLSSHTAAIVDAVAGLPPQTLERYPVLQIINPMTALRARTAGATPLIQTDPTRPVDDAEADFLILAQLIAFRASGDIEPAVLMADRLKDRLQHVRVNARDRLDGPLWFFHHQIGTTRLAAGDSVGALLEFATARQLGALSAQSDAERTVLGRIALTHAVRGVLTDAEQALHQARKLPPPTPANVSAATGTESTAAALIAVEQLSVDLDDRVAALIPYDANDLVWPYALLARVRTALCRQQPEDANESVRLAREAHTVSRGSHAFDIVGATSIECLAAVGDMVSADEAADNYQGGGPMTLLATARLRQLQHDPRAATRLLRHAERVNDLAPIHRAEAALLGAMLELVQHDEVSTNTAMRVYWIVRQTDHRRLTCQLPSELVVATRQRLAPDVRLEFDAAVDGILHSEMTQHPALTAAETRVLNALPSPATVGDIAAAFHVSPNTVKAQLRSLYRKLNCSSREAAISTAVRLHLLVVDDTSR